MLPASNLDEVELIEFHLIHVIGDIKATNQMQQ
jgi:hypothetical protein